jgi:hypothetical protein
MMNKKHLENILRINGVSPTAPDETIRSVLVGAHFHDDEIETALTVLRQNTVTNTSRLDGLHKVFRTDDRLAPVEIAKLLGIEVKVDCPDKFHKNARQEETPPRYSLIVFLAGVFSVVAVLATMYFLRIGIFHPAAPM